MASEKRLTEKHYSGNGYYLKCSSDCPNDGFCDDCEKLYKAIDRLGEYEEKEKQTVDAVEVVRCRDCRYSTLENGDLWCDDPIGIYGKVGLNDFCSYGERKDNERKAD